MKTLELHLETPNKQTTLEKQPHTSPHMTSA